MEKKNDMLAKIMLSYAFTFMMIEIADTASVLLDGLIISRFLGPTQLAATGLGNTSFQMVSLFCSIFAIGIQVSCSSAMGTGDSKKTSELFSEGIIVVTAIAVVVTILAFSFLKPLCLLFGATPENPELFDGLYDYLRGWFVGIPGFIGFSVLCPLVTLDGNKKRVTAVTILQSGINLVGDYLSVAVFDIGTLGVGLSTGIAFDVAVVLLILNFTRKRTAFKFKFRKPEGKAIAGMMRIGLPRLTKYGCKLLSPLLVNRTIIAVGGASAMAAMSVKTSISGVCLAAGVGIAESVNLLSQVFYSEKDKESLQKTARKAIKADAIFCTVLSVLIFFFARRIAGFYMDTASYEYSITATMLRFFALSVLFNGINQGVLSYLQGTRRMLPAHLETASHRLVFIALSTFVFGKLFGVNGLFLAIPVSELLVLLAYIAVTLIRGKGKNARDALMLLPNDFGYTEEESLSFSLTTPEEVVGISEKVNDFCETHGVDHRRSYYAALCIEEIAGNVVAHGFKKDNKPHSCEVRVMLEDDDVVLRVRDDCRYFNMKERYEAMKDADRTKNVGIRLVYGIAKDVSYVNLLNTNTLIIRI